MIHWMVGGDEHKAALADLMDTPSDRGLVVSREHACVCSGVGLRCALNFSLRLELV